MATTTTSRRWRPTGLPALAALTLTAAACAATGLGLAGRHLLAACEGAAVPWSHFALAYAGLVGAVLALVLYTVARVRAAPGTGRTAAGGRAGLVTAVCALVVLVAAGLAVRADHQQAAMAEAHAERNVLIACTSG
jgi:hypothetical protein